MTEEPERTLADLEDKGDQVGDHIDEARGDWEHKKNDSSVPGAEPARGDDDKPAMSIDSEEGEAAADAGQ